MHQVERLRNLWWERKLGIHTRGIISSDHDDFEHNEYATVRYRMVAEILDHLRLTDNDTFVDLGCGKGRIVCCASLRHPARVIGIELSVASAEIARDNAARLRGRHAPIDIIAVDVTEFDFSVGSVFYLFHSFGPVTLHAVLELLDRGLQQCPRTVRFVYVNPIHDEVFQGFPWLNKTAEWNVATHPSLQHTVQWWTNAISASDPDAPSGG